MQLLFQLLLPEKQIKNKKIKEIFEKIFLFL